MKITSLKNILIHQRNYSVLNKKTFWLLLSIYKFNLKLHACFEFLGFSKKRLSDLTFFWKKFEFYSFFFLSDFIY